MFGSLGGMEVLVIFVLALLLFGPRKLPEIGRMLGKTVGEFRRATQEFRSSLEREVELERVKDAGRELRDAGRVVQDAVRLPDMTPTIAPPAIAHDAPAAPSEPEPRGTGGEPSAAAARVGEAEPKDAVHHENT